MELGQLSLDVGAGAEKLIQELPRNEIGKVLRRELVAGYETAVAGDAGGAFQLRRRQRAVELEAGLRKEERALLLLLHERLAH